jgi:hypothetical protein
MVPSASDHTPHRTDYLKERYDRVTQWWHKEKPLGQDERVLEQVKQCFNELQLHVEMAGIARKAGLGDESVKLEKVIDDYTQIIDIDIQIIHNFLDGQKMPLYAEPPNLLPLIQTHSPSTPLTQDEIRREVGGIRMKTRSHTQQWGDSWFAHVWASEALSFSKHKETLPLAQRCLERARQLSDAVLAGKSPDPFPLPRTLWDGSTSTVAPRGRSQIVHLSMPPREKSRTPVPH